MNISIKEKINKMCEEVLTSSELAEVLLFLLGVGISFGVIGYLWSRYFSYKAK